MDNEKILDEYDAVKNNVGLFDFSMEGKIKITGNGRIDFINGIVSNDVENLKENNGVYAAFLDRFGKVLTDCIIYKFKDFLLINLSFMGKKNIIEKLKDDAPLGKSEVEDLTLKYALFSLQGPRSTELLKIITNQNIQLEKQYQFTLIKIDNKAIEIIITRNKRTTEDGYDIFVPSDIYKEFKDFLINEGKNFGLKIINNGTYNILRLEAKIPLYSVDFSEKNLLSEITEKAISYEKGCFVGQEIVARIKTLAHGLTAKRLMYLEIDTAIVPKKNDKIMKDNEEVGHITSAAFSPKLNKVIALGFLKKGFYESDTIVEVGSNGTKGKICSSI